MTRSNLPELRSSTSPLKSGYAGVSLMPAAFVESAMIWIAVIQSDQPFGTMMRRLMSDPFLFSTKPSPSVSR
jgi:hypothetical protein